MSDTGPGELPGDYLDLVDLYCSGLIDDLDFHRLEAMLLEHEGARRHFVDYFQHHTEIQFAIRASRAADAVLDQLSLPPVRLTKPNRPGQWRLPEIRMRWWIGIAAGALLLATVVAASRVGIPIGSVHRGTVRVPSRQRRPTSRGWSTLRTAGGRARARSRAATCGPARSCGWNEDWPKSSSTGVRG